MINKYTVPYLSSIGDIYMVVKHDSAQIRAVTAGYIYVLHRPDTGWATSFIDVAEEIEAEIMGNVIKLMHQKATKQQMLDAYDKGWQKLSAQTGVKYDKIRC